ncbi:MAG: helix-turn-helix domain-containing protein [Thermoleophilia bacterium]|nr:helix-turn-helix domain-containing protein [Thermoleophilia bacterium]
MSTPGQLLSDARHNHGVSQKRLAIRAGTTQSAISRIERDHVSPSVETLRDLLHMLGEDLVLGSESRDAGIDRTLNQANLARPMSDRLDFGVGFANQVISMSPLPKRPTMT